PQFYELLYTYATGVNPALNARINALFREGDPSIDLAERLYNEFLRAQDANERITAVSERMSVRIDAVHDAIDTALSTAATYTGVLEAADRNLSAASTPEEMRALSRKLL